MALINVFSVFLVLIVRESTLIKHNTSCGVSLEDAKIFAHLPRGGHIIMVICKMRLVCLQTIAILSESALSLLTLETGLLQNHSLVVT